MPAVQGLRGITAASACTVEQPPTVYKHMHVLLLLLQQQLLILLLLLMLLLMLMLPQTADTDGFGWLDFDMPREEQKRLFKNGAIAGRDLLKK
jgi:hypothetical protein